MSQQPSEGGEAQPGADLPLVWERPVSIAPPAVRLPAAYRAYRVHLTMVGAALVPLIALMVPTLEIVFLGIVWVSTRSTELSQRLGPALGIIAAVALVAFMSNWLALLGNGRFERKLRAIYKTEFGREGGELVGIGTPDAGSFYRRYLEGHSDVGMLYLDADALVFEGLRKRVVVERTAMKGVGLAMNWQFVQFRARWCVVRYARGDGGDGGGGEQGETPAELRIYCRSGSSIRRNVAATEQLRTRIERWWAHTGQ